MKIIFLQVEIAMSKIRTLTCRITARTMTTTMFLTRLPTGESCITCNIYRLIVLSQN